MWNMIPCLQSDQSECSRSFKHRITQAWLWRNRLGVNQCWKFEEYNTVTIKMYWWFHQLDLEKVKHYTLCHLHLTFEREVVETVSLFINFSLSIDLLDKDQVSSLKVARNSFLHFSRSRFWWVIITTLYQLMLQSCYQKVPNHWWTRWYYFRDTICYHSNNMTC